MRRHPARDVDADRGDLPRRPRQPDAGEPVDPLALDPERRERPDERLLEVADVLLHVLAVPLEVEDRVADELARRRGRSTCRRGRSRPPRPPRRRARAARLLVGAAPERDHRRVLEEEHRVRDRPLRDGAPRASAAAPTPRGTAPRRGASGTRRWPRSQGTGWDDPGTESPRAVVLVEGSSDRIALEALAGRLGRDLADERVEIRPSAAPRRSPGRSEGLAGSGIRLAGLCDEAEERHFRAGARRRVTAAAMERLGFFVGVENLERRADPRARRRRRRARSSMADGRSRDVPQLPDQPAWRSRPVEAQLRRGSTPSNGGTAATLPCSCAGSAEPVSPGRSAACSRPYA